MNTQLSFEGQSFVTINNFDQNGLQPSLKANNVVTTAQEDHTMQEERFYQMEDINSENSIQLSFEKSFMTEHSTVLTLELQNYMQSVRIYLQDSNKKMVDIFSQSENKKNEMTSFREVFSGMEAQFTLEFKIRLLEELSTYTKLQEMLDIIVGRCPQEMAVELILISDQILREYVKCVNDSVEWLDLYLLMDLAFQKSKKLENIKYLNLNFIASPSIEYRKFSLHYQKFIEIYCVTTILVIGSFFQNPYYQKQTMEVQLKRPLRQFEIDDNIEMEEEVDAKPQKRRKSSK